MKNANFLLAKIALLLSFLLFTWSITLAQIDGVIEPCSNEPYQYDLLVFDDPNNVFVWEVEFGQLVASTTGTSAMIEWFGDINQQGQVTVIEHRLDGSSITHPPLDVDVTVLNPFIIPEIIPGCPEPEPDGDPQPGDDDREEENNCVRACEKSEFIYHASGLPGSSYQWFVTEGTIIGSNTMDIVTIEWGAAPAQGIITLIETTSNSCSDTVYLCVDILETPVADFEIENLSFGTVICTSQVVNFNDLSFFPSGNGEIVRWLWDFGDGTISTEENPSHVYNTAINTTVTLIVYSECGCSNTVQLPIQVEDTPPPQIEFCASVACPGDETLVIAVDDCPGGYHWDVTGASSWSVVPDPSGSGNQILVTWDNPVEGYGVISLTTDCSPCAATQVRVPIVSSNTNITGPGSGCVNDVVQFSVPPMPGSEYTWTITLLGSPLGPTVLNFADNEINFTPDQQGQYEISVDYTNEPAGGCSGSAGPITFWAIPPEVVAGPPVVCLLDNPMLTNTNAMGEIRIVAPNGTQSVIAANTNFTFTEVGTHFIQAFNTGCAEDPFEIVVIERPEAPIEILGPDMVCLGTPYSYSVAPLAGTYVEWSFTSGSGVITPASGSNTVNVTWDTYGTLSAVRQNINIAACGSLPTELTVTELAPSNPMILGDEVICANSLETYTLDFANAEDYTWTLTPPIGSIIIGSPGSNTIEIQWNDVPNPPSLFATLSCEARYCGTETVSADLDIELTPANRVSIEPLMDACAGAPVVFSTLDVYGGDYTWSINPPVAGFDRSGPGLTNFSYAFGPNHDGDYIVSLVVTGGDPLACQLINDQTTAPITINPGPAATISSNATCIDETTVSGQIIVSLQSGNIGANYQYEWTLDGVIDPMLNTAIIDVTVPGTYTCTLTDINTGCVSVLAFTIDCSEIEDPGCTLEAGNALDFDIVYGPPGACGGIEVSDNSSVASGWEIINPLFTLNDNGTEHEFNSLNFNYNSFDVAGVFHIRYELTFRNLSDPNDTCRVFTEDFVDIPIVPFARVEYVCDGGGQIIRLVDESTILPDIEYTVTWVEIGSNVPNEIVGPGTDGSIDITDPGLAPGTVLDFEMQISIDDFPNPGDTYTCTSSWPEELIIPFPPDPTIMDDGFRCVNSPIEFTANSPATGFWSYSWDFDDGSVLSGARITSHSFTAPGAYNVELTVRDQNGCEATVDQDITIIANPLLDGTLTANPTGNLCAPDIVTLTFNSATGVGTEFDWSNGQTTTVNTISVNTTGSYLVTVTDDNGCAVVTPSVPVNITPQPVAAIYGDLEYCTGEDLLLTTVPGMTYEWSIDGGPVIRTTQQLSLNPQNNGIVNGSIIELTVDNGVCTNTNQAQITIHPPLPNITVSAEILSCEDPYTAELIAKLGTGLSYYFNWSDGQFTSGSDESIINVLQGGNYSVLVTDEHGCTAEANIDAPSPPNFELFCSGCYEFCDVNDINIQFPVPLEGWYSWTFHGASTGPQTGTGQVANPLIVQEPGDYYLEVKIVDAFGNPCTYTSDIMHVTLVDPECDGYELSFDLNDVDGQYADGDALFWNLDVSVPSDVIASYTYDDGTGPGLIGNFDFTVPGYNYSFSTINDFFNHISTDVLSTFVANNGTYCIDFYSEGIENSEFYCCNATTSICFEYIEDECDGFFYGAWFDQDPAIYCADDPITLTFNTNPGTQVNLELVQPDGTVENAVYFPAIAPEPFSHIHLHLFLDEVFGIDMMDQQCGTHVLNLQFIGVGEFKGCIENLSLEFVYDCDCNQDCCDDFYVDLNLNRSPFIYCKDDILFGEWTASCPAEVNVWIYDSQGNTLTPSPTTITVNTSLSINAMSFEEFLQGFGLEEVPCDESYTIAFNAFGIGDDYVDCYFEDKLDFEYNCECEDCCENFYFNGGLLTGTNIFCPLDSMWGFWESSCPAEVIIDICDEDRNLLIQLDPFPVDGYDPWDPILVEDFFEELGLGCDETIIIKYTAVAQGLNGKTCEEQGEFPITLECECSGCWAERDPEFINFRDVDTDPNGSGPQVILIDANDDINNDGVITLNGHYYIDALIVVENVTLDITNCDLVFDPCTSLNFADSSLLRANNSVFRPCDLYDTWNGISFANDTLNIINECTFKNAWFGVGFNDRSRGRVQNNLFQNCNLGIGLFLATEFDYPIAGNSFVFDQDIPDFRIIEECDPNIFHFGSNIGILAFGANAECEISQNIFVNNYPASQNYEAIGIAVTGGSMRAKISENTFSDFTHAISFDAVNNIPDDFPQDPITSEGGQFAVENNEIEISRFFDNGASQIQVSNSTAEIGIIGNEIKTTFSQVFTDSGFFGIEIGESSNVDVIDNTVIGGFSIGILGVRSSFNRFNDNDVKDFSLVGIAMSESTQSEINCNTVEGNGIDEDLWGIAVVGQGTSNIDVFSNCVFNTSVSVMINAFGDDDIIDHNVRIRNNFLHSYSETGVMNVGFVDLEIGTSDSDPGQNTFWSNSNAIDVAATVATSLWDNYGVFAITPATVSILHNEQEYSVASCAHQVADPLSTQGNLKPEYICDFPDQNWLDGLQSDEVLSEMRSTENDDYRFELALQYLIEQQSISSVEAEKWYEKLISEKILSSEYEQFFKYQKAKMLGDKNMAYAILEQMNFNGEASQYFFADKLLLEDELGIASIEEISDEQLDRLRNIALIPDSRSNTARYILIQHFGESFLYVNTFERQELQIDEDLVEPILLSEELTIQVAPNPVTQVLNVRLNREISGNAELAIYDVLGRAVIDLEVLMTTGQTEIDVNKLTSGVYMLTLREGDDKVHTVKFVKK